MRLDVNTLINNLSNDYFENVVFGENKVSTTADGKKEVVFSKNEDKLKEAKASYLKADPQKDFIIKARDKATKEQKAGSLFKDANSIATSAEKMFAVMEYYKDLFMNNGYSSYDASRGHTSCADFFKEMKDMHDVLNDRHSVGGTFAVMTQTIVQAATEILPVEPSIHEFVAIPFDIQPNAIFKYPYVQMDAPGGLFQAEGQDLKTTNFGTDEDVNARRDDVGIKVSLSHQEIENSQSYDLIKLHFAVAKNALTQFKNQLLVSALYKSGTVLFDNLDPTNSVMGETSGRAYTTGFPKNQTMTFLDFKRAHMYGIKKGIRLNTVLVSTEGFEVFDNCPEIRRYLENKATVYYDAPMANVGRTKEPMWRVMSQEPTGEYNRIAPSLPAGFTNVPFKFIVTKFMPTFSPGDKVLKSYDIKNNIQTYYKDGLGDDLINKTATPYTSICMLDASQAVMYLEGKSEYREKDDKWEGHFQAKFLEQYAFHVLRKGHSVVWIKNVAVVDAPIFDLSSIKPVVNYTM